MEVAMCMCYAGGRLEIEFMLLCCTGEIQGWEPVQWHGPQLPENAAFPCFTGSVVELQHVPATLTAAAGSAQVSAGKAYLDAEQAR